MKTFRQNRQQHRPKKNMLVVGRKEVVNALEQGVQLDRIYMSATGNSEGIEEIKQLAAERMVPINKVPVEKLNSFNVSNHHGCIALKSKIQYQDLQQVISFVVDKGEAPLFLILDGITDIRNIGGIARTAVCCGVHAIIIPDKGMGALNDDAIATSAGALEQIAICRVNSLVKAVDDLHLNGISVYASEMTATASIFDMKFTNPCAFVLGSEDKGISPTLIKVCDSSFKIPMAGQFESLNVSVAGAMMLYEAMKQRMSV